MDRSVDRTAVEMLSDDALVARTQAGDQTAFARLVERHHRPLYALAYRLLGHPADAEDATQETFLRAYTRLHTYHPDGHFAAWLAAIGTHWCLDLLRSRGRRVRTVALGAVLEGERGVSGQAGPETLALQGATRDEVQGWLGALPAHYRTVLVLRYLHERSYTEIAAILGETKDTVRMRLHRARTMLQQVVVRERQAAPPAPLPLLARSA